MSLKRPTTGVCHALIRIPTQSGPACSVEVSRTKWPLLHHVVQAVHKECHKDTSPDRIQTVSTIPTLLKLQHRSSPGSIHISTDGRPSLTKTQPKPNITKDGKTCMTLMTAWLSITTQYNSDPKV
jgi:hypothetical protein